MSRRSGSLRVGDDAVRDNVLLELCVLCHRPACPHVLDRVRVAPAVLVLRVLVGVLAVGVEDDLADPQGVGAQRSSNVDLRMIFVVFDLPVRVIPNRADFWLSRSAGVMATRTSPMRWKGRLVDA